MARFVMANRRAGKFTTSSKLASRAAMENVMSSSFMTGASVLAENWPKKDISRRAVLFEANANEIAARLEGLPRDVIVEPEIIHRHSAVRPMEFLSHAGTSTHFPAAFGTTRTLTVRVRGNGKSLRGALVTLYLRGLGQSSEMTGTTDGNGRVVFTFSEHLNAATLLAEPAGDFWNQIVHGPPDPVVVNCPELPDAEKHLGWWHTQLGLKTWAKTRGSGIRVGVIDSGVGPNGELDHVTSVGSFIDSVFDPQGGADVDQHGTHVCGTIGSRPTAQSRFGGVAPGARLYSARVFPPEVGANQLDIANAIDDLSKECQADLINMSLGAEEGSQIEFDAIQDALERGTVCVCAAGNEAGPVIFPAAFDQTVAVSALGKMGQGAMGSLSSIRIPDFDEDHGEDNLYLANFSNYGSEITCTGPGVAIVATVPERFGLKKPQTAMDGTSMASPVVCGALAVILSRSPEFKAMERNGARAAFALKLLKTACETVGLPAYSEGAGIPQI